MPLPAAWRGGGVSEEAFGVCEAGHGGRGAPRAVLLLWADSVLLLVDAQGACLPKLLKSHWLRSHLVLGTLWVSGSYGSRKRGRRRIRREREEGEAHTFYVLRCSSFFPYCSPMRVVIGKPVAVPKTTTPSPEQVAECHRQFVEAMEELFERHKGAAGHADLKLQVL